MVELKLTDEETARFWSKVDRRGPNDCWLWLGWKTPDGYGRFDVAKRKPLATRLALDLDGRPRPSHQHFALHGDCSNPSCCNPAHLRWGTKLENADDRDRLGRRVRVPRGEANANAKITEDIVREIRASPLLQRELAEIYGLCRIHVGMIKRRQVWAHVT